jgi:hypothetical protein
MATAVTGDDRAWNLSGYGVLGTATPRTVPTQGGSTDNVDSYGVWGLLGTPEDNANIVDEVTSNTSIGPNLRAAINGRNSINTQGFAVYGETRPLDAVASAFGFIAGHSPYAGEVTGVFGQGGERGVIGIAGVANGIGVYGGSVGGTGIGVFGDAGDNQPGVVGRSNGLAGVGVRAENVGGGLAAHIVGDLKVDGRVVGDLSLTGDVFLQNGDIGERFTLALPNACTPGTVMVIGEAGALVPCSRQYDTRVIGVISGAGSLGAALTLRNTTCPGPNAVIALVGTVYCLADAAHGPIEARRSPSRIRHLRARDAHGRSATKLRRADRQGACAVAGRPRPDPDRRRPHVVAQEPPHGRRW